LNIVIIGTHDISGGAARAMYRLHKGFQNIGENAYIISKIKKSDNAKVFKINPIFDLVNHSNIETKKWIQDEYIDNGRSKLSNTLFTFPYYGYDLSELEIIQKADIINLHWVALFQSPETISRLLSLGKPVVWTLHDMRAFSGGCHYSAGCRGFEDGCFNCPQIANDDLNIPAMVLQLQKKYYGNSQINIVTPSKWLAEEAKKSAVFCNSKVEVILNGLDINVFRPTDKHEARKILGLDSNKKYLLFGADSTGSTYKGFNLLLETLSKLNRVDDIVLLIFGSEHEDIKQLNISYKCFSKVKDDEKLSIIYSAADIFLLPSYEDNLPNVMLESFACGTPVVAFEVGGAADIINNGATGYLVPAYDTSIFSLKVEALLNNDMELVAMSRSCIEFANHNFSVEKQANAYKELFLKLCIKCEEDVPHIAFSDNLTIDVNIIGMQNDILGC